MVEALKLYDLSKHLNVLYVEDDRNLHIKTAAILKEIFHSVDVAWNGQEAFTLYEEYFYNTNKYYDIVVTDIKMPKMDGLELSKKIKQLNQDQTIVVTSAHDESNYLIEFINLGINRFIKKPFSFDSIVQTFLVVCEKLDQNQVSLVDLGEQTQYDKKTKKLFENSQEIKLSRSEVVILDTLLANPTTVFAAVDFYSIIQSDSFDQEFSIDSVKSVIKRLRKKLPEGLVENIYGQGYRLKNLN